MSEVVLESALAYLKLGWRVVPLHYPIFRDDGVRCSCGNSEGPSKHPLGKHPVA